jgi:hypothetical protein
MPIGNGVRLAIAHLKFDVKIKYAQAINPDYVDEKSVWVVICKICGGWHKVDNKTDTLDFCVKCANRADATEISGVRAVLRSEAEWKLHA